MRSYSTHQATNALARGQVATFNRRGMDLLVASNRCEDFSRTKNAASRYFNSPSSFTMCVDLSLTPCRVYHASGVRGRPGLRLRGRGPSVLLCALRASIDAGNLSLGNQGGRSTPYGLDEA